jgi:predicted nucleic acid-binding protein
MPCAGIETVTTADRLVLDASAALAILRGEPAAGEVVARLRAALEAGPVRVPDLFWLEVVNVLVRRDGWDPDAVVEAIQALDELGLDTAPVDRPLLLLGLDLMAALGLTAYDAAYLALAEADDAALLTLDDRLSAAAGTRSALRRRHRAGEAPAPYETRRPSWPRFGRYLADLRRATATLT